MIRVVLAEDHALVREGFRAILDLQDDIEVVAEAEDGLEALTVCAKHRPDVLIVDVQMLRLDGLAVTERIKAQPEPTPAVLVLTTFSRDDYVFRALRAGAAGFLLKDVTRTQLLHAVRVVAAGEELLSPTITRRLVERFLRSPVTSGLLDDLTQRERDVLRLVGHGMSNQEIAAELVLGEATVKTHLGNVFTKCGLRDRAQAVVLAHESGLVAPGS